MSRIVVAAFLWCVAGAVGAAAPTATIDSGRLAGFEADGVEQFLGIPFAAPPLGVLRWRAPQPVRVWGGLRPATRYSHDCMQTPYPSDAAPLGAQPDEDCLYLNVWRPVGTPPGKKLPVLVWIYGGGFVNGGASPAVYSGTPFARDGVLFVSFNYRVGRFGFFGFPELTRENADHGLLVNYGYLDVLAGLQWVQRNIAAFGGDSRQVTVYGQSAGAGQVYMLLTSPLAHGLFARAIVQSGGAVDRPLLHPTDGSANPSEAAGMQFARRWGIRGTDAAALRRLRALSARQVADGLHIGTMASQASTFIGPVRDGTILPLEPLLQVFASGANAHVPMIIGATAGDNNRNIGSTTEAAFKYFGDAATRVRAAYAVDAPTDPQVLIREIGRDLQYREPARFIVTRLEQQGQAGYEYRYRYVVTPMRQDWTEGPPHATDIPFAMDTVRAKYDKLSPTDLAVAHMLHDYWVNFVRRGDPNGPGLPEWPAYDPSRDQLLDFGTDGIPRAVNDPRKDRLDALATWAGRL